MKPLEAWSQEELLELAEKADRPFLGLVLVSFHHGLTVSKAAIESLRLSEYRAGDALKEILELIGEARADGIDVIRCEELLEICAGVLEKTQPPRLH